ncbi:MAG: aspartate kinase, partial [Bacteroidota bacterium]
RTDSNFGDAVVNFELTNKLIQNKFSTLQKNLIPVVNGFTGSDENGDTTSLGRSGSDYTATIIGAALKVDLVEIWTDVDGVLSADPKIVDDAQTLDELSYEEANNLALLGGKVIHPKTIVPAEKQNVPISILNSLRPEGRGTYIGKNGFTNGDGIRTITYLQGLSRVDVNELESRHAQNIFLRLFSLISRLGIPIITINKSATHQSISFITHAEVAHYFYGEIKREFSLDEENGYIGNISRSNNLALISAIGCKPEYNSSITKKIYDTLEEKNIEPVMFFNDPSALNISFIVSQSEVKNTIAVLHEEFFQNKLNINVA